MALMIIFTLLCSISSGAAQFFDRTSCLGLQVTSASGSGISAQPPSTIPYTINVSSSSFYAGNTVDVKIQAKNDSRNTFQGIMLQVRPSDETLMTYGSWDFPPTTGLTSLSCLGNSLGTIVNARDDVKTLPLTLSWISPADPQLPNVQIVASFVEEAGIFWENIPMIELQVIEDTTPPVIDEHTCPDTVIAYVLPGETSRAVTWDEPTATDNSGNLMVNSNHAPGDVFSSSFTFVEYDFTDVSGNTATCRFPVRVLQDNQPPEVECPDDVTENVMAESGGKSIVWPDPEVSDNSEYEVDLVFQSHSKGDIFQPGVTTVTYTYQDKSGNSAQCSFNVTLIAKADLTPPVVNSCPTDIFRTIPFSSEGAVVNWTEPTATDDSARSVEVVSNKKPADFFYVGITNVTYTFSDEEENKAYCIFIVNVTQVDILPPVIHDCPDNITTNIASDAESVTVNWTEPTAVDDSGDVIATSNYQPGSAFLPGITTVWYNFTDRHENKISCIFYVNVWKVDILPPEIHDCPNNITINIESDAASVTVNWTEPIAVDDSGDVIATSNYQPGSVFLPGITTIWYNFTDRHENKISCSFYVNVWKVNCPSNIIPAPAATEGIRVDWLEPTTTDQSGDAKFVSRSHDPGQLFTVGNTEVTYTFQDSTGNTALCSFKVIVKEQKDEPGVSVVLYVLAGGGVILLAIIFIAISVCCYRLGKKGQSQPENNSLDEKAPVKTVESLEEQNDQNDNERGFALYDLPAASRRYDIPLSERGRYSKHIVLPTGIDDTSFSNGDNGENDYMDPEVLFRKKDLHEIVGLDQ